MAAPELVPWINSAGEDGDRNSMQTFPGNGVQKSFDFSFAGGYIFATDVKAYKYNLASGLTVAVEPVVLTGPSTIFVDPAPAAVNVEGTVGEMLVVYRDTQKTVPLVDYSTGAVMSEENLDMSNKQAVFVAAEMTDRFDAINASSADAIERSFEALTKAEEALDRTTDAEAAASAAAASASAAQASADTAVTTANNALTVANGIDAKAQTALDNSEDAIATANAAAAAADGQFDTDVDLFTGAGTQRDIRVFAGTEAAPGVQRAALQFSSSSTVAVQRHNQTTGAVIDTPLRVDQANGKVMTTNGVHVNNQRIEAVGAPATSTDAINRAYIDAALPAGMIAPFAFTGDIPGWVVCDGRAVSRTTLAALFAAIGTYYGVGDGSTTFNVPNYQGYFLRGLGGSSAGLGVEQLSQNIAHTHGVTDPGHDHGITDPGHNHPLPFQSGGPVAGATAYQGALNAGTTATTGSSATGIDIIPAVTGVSIQSSGGTEARPVNKAVVYRIKT